MVNPVLNRCIFRSPGAVAVHVDAALELVLHWQRRGWSAGFSGQVKSCMLRLAATGVESWNGELESWSPDFYTKTPSWTCLFGT